MKEQLINFETAKLAKEKGFTVPWRVELTTIYYKDSPQPSKWMFRKYNKWEKLPKYYAVTQSLLQKWLRIKHDIHVEPTLNFTSDEFPMHFNCGIMINISSIKTFKWAGLECTYIFYKKYEEALEVGLIEALKLI